MDGETFRSRLLMLLQRSRQAHRLYSSMERTQKGEAAEYTEMQAAAWRAVNAELVKQLTALLDAPHSRQMSSQVILLRDRFLAEFREVEAAVNQRHREVVVAAERGDFIRTALVSRSLVSLKARSQAAFAAFSEIEEALKGVSGTVSSSTISLPQAPAGFGDEHRTDNLDSDARGTHVRQAERVASGDLSLESGAFLKRNARMPLETQSGGRQSSAQYQSNRAGSSRAKLLENSPGASQVALTSEVAEFSLQATGAELVRRMQGAAPHRGAVAGGLGRQSQGLHLDADSRRSSSEAPREAKVIPLRRRSS